MIVGRRCVGDVGEGSIGRGWGSGCFMRPLTFTSAAFQSAVSIKDGCSSYVFLIHQRPRDTRPHADGRLDMMEEEKVGIRHGERESENSKNLRRGRRGRGKGAISGKYSSYSCSQTTGIGKKPFHVKAKWWKMSFAQ